MGNIISDTVSRLSGIIDSSTVNWNDFDAALTGLENINVYDDQYEETILSELILDGNFYDRGAILTDVVRHFLACGYDVAANDGANGNLALQALCWASYDRHILDAAKVLMNADPIHCGIGGDDRADKYSGLLECISWKLSGAWMVDKDSVFANTLEAYYAMTEATIAGKDHNAIDHYGACIGKPLTSVSAVKLFGRPTLYEDGAVSIYSEPLILWFEDRPLVASCYTDFVVNPVYAGDEKDNLADVSAAFSSLIGAALQEVQYMGSTICYFAFSNGKRLFFASCNMGDRNRVGTLEIHADNWNVDAMQLQIQYFCGINGTFFADTVTKYDEDAVALFCEDTAYLLYPRPHAGGRYQLGLCPCSRALLAEYTRQYPLKHPGKTIWMYEQDSLSAVRLDFSEGHLYMATTEYPGIEIQLSDRLYDPLEHSALPRDAGKHMKFTERSDGDLL